VAHQKSNVEAEKAAAEKRRIDFLATRNETFAKVEAALARKKPHDVLAMLEPHKSYLDTDLKARFDTAWAATAPEREALAERERKAAQAIAKAAADREAADKATIARIGNAPVAYAWDGSYGEVERYLERVANDPDSIDIEGCSKSVESKKGWIVRCEYRGKNAFGALIKKNGLFVISHGQVVSASDL